MVPAWRHILDGAERADSLVVNPHKWLFTPFDLSALYCRRMDVVRAGVLARRPSTCKTTEPDAVRNLMDTGIQLGRRFRALKLWMVLRHFGADGIRARLAEHMRLAQLFAAGSTRRRSSSAAPGAVQRRLLPLPSHRGRRTTRHGALQRVVLDAVNRSGEVFLSHTKLDGRYVIRLAVGNLRTTERHVQRAWDLLQEHAGRLVAPGSFIPSSNAPRP